MTKILLVEDDKSLREIYGVRLIAEGYQIASAGDGEQALAMAVKEHPDLIISDVMMPKISGFDMLDILRTTPETKNLKVIMMTALSSEDQRARGESLGADRYLVKSQVGIEDVVRTVHDVLADSPITATSANSTFTSSPAPSDDIEIPQPTSTLAPESAPALGPEPIQTPAPMPTPTPMPFVPPVVRPAETAAPVSAPMPEPTPAPMPTPVAFTPPVTMPTPAPVPAPESTPIPVASFFAPTPISTAPPMPAPAPADEKIVEPPMQPPVLDIAALINQELNETSAPTQPEPPIQ